jgi:hypothetical protein
MLNSSTASVVMPKPNYQEVQRITGTKVNEATALVFTSGTMILALLLAESVPTDTWSGPSPTNP